MPAKIAVYSTPAPSRRRAHAAHLVHFVSVAGFDSSESLSLRRLAAQSHKSFGRDSFLHPCHVRQRPAFSAWTTPPAPCSTSSSTNKKERHGSSNTDRSCRSARMASGERTSADSHVAQIGSLSKRAEHPHTASPCSKAQETSTKPLEVFIQSAGIKQEHRLIQFISRPIASLTACAKACSVPR